MQIKKPAIPANLVGKRERGQSDEKHSNHEIEADKAAPIGLGNG